MDKNLTHIEKEEVGKLADLILLFERQLRNGGLPPDLIPQIVAAFAEMQINRYFGE